MQCAFGKTVVLEKKFVQTTVLPENVYNLLPKPEGLPNRPIRYRSVHSDAVKAFYKSQKATNKTMGPLKVELAGPQNFLTKRSRERRWSEFSKKGFVQSLQLNEYEHMYAKQKKPPVPKHNERPHSIYNPSKDFIKENIRNACRLPARRPVPKVVDSRKGASILLEFSGLVPKYCEKMDYGEIPNYLVRREDDMKYNAQKYAEFVREQLEKRAPRRILDNERADLIIGLKKKWSILNKEYIALPLLADTYRRKITKDELESKLQVIEKDIQLLEKHAEIYVLKGD